MLRYSVVKRAMDIIGALLMLVLSLPVFIALIVGVWLCMGRPILYRQERVGLNEHIFRLWKFRTMNYSRDSSGRLLPDAQRLSSFGQFLRRWSLDEIPQFINVLDGSLSLVGPRPLLVRYLPRYSQDQRRRHLVKPGLTGLAQINGRNALSWERRFKYDVEYVDHYSLWLDVKIILKTLLILFQRSGSGARAGAELAEFWGAEGPPNGSPLAMPVEERETLTPSLQARE